MKQAKTHFEGTATPEYPHNVITACGVNGFRIENCDGEFDIAAGDRYSFTTDKKRVDCGRCKASRDFRLC